MTARKEPARKEPARKEPAKKEPAKKKTAKKKTAKKKTAKKKTAKKKTAKKQTAKKKAKRKKARTFSADDAYFLGRSVSKTGGFGLAREELEAFARQGLTAAEVASLYEAVFLAGERAEEEWRDEFLAAFPEHADQVPSLEATPGKIDIAGSLFWAIQAGDLESVDMTLSYLDELDPSLKPPELRDDRGRTLLEAARDRGDPELIACVEHHVRPRR